MAPPRTPQRVSFDPGSDGEPATATAGGTCTYEELAAVTLAHGYVPAVVPHLRATTLGEAVGGLGLGPSSFRNGLARESVLGDTALLRVELERVRGFVALRTVRFVSPVGFAAAVALVSAERAWDGETVDFVDGAVFSRQESYLVLGSRSDDVPAVSDYTGRAAYHSSLRERGRDALTVPDYLWRWDTASRRRIGVQRLRGRPAPEQVERDVVVPVEEAAGFLERFLDHDGPVPATPLRVCPLRLRDRDGPPGAPSGPPADGGTPWEPFAVEAGRTYVGIGVRETVPIRPGTRR